MSNEIKQLEEHCIKAAEEFAMGCAKNGNKHNADAGEILWKLRAENRLEELFELYNHENPHVSHCAAEYTLTLDAPRAEKQLEDLILNPKDFYTFGEKERVASSDSELTLMSWRTGEFTPFEESSFPSKAMAQMTNEYEVGVFASNGNYCPIGDSDYVWAYLSTISYHLEPDGWATKYPLIVEELWTADRDKGLPDSESCLAAIEELKEIEKQLEQMPTNKVIWDITDLSIKPPEEYDFRLKAKNLNEYFITEVLERFQETFSACILDGLNRSVKAWEENKVSDYCSSTRINLRNDPLPEEDREPKIVEDSKGRKVTYDEDYETPDYKSSGLITAEVILDEIEDESRGSKYDRSCAIIDRNLHDGSVWYNHPDGVTMWEVPEELHNFFSHRSHWHMSKPKKSKAKKKPEVKSAVPALSEKEKKAKKLERKMRKDIRRIRPVGIGLTKDREALEKKYGFEFPEDYRMFLLYHNGCDFDGEEYKDYAIPTLNVFKNTEDETFVARMFSITTDDKDRDIETRTDEYINKYSSDVKDRLPKKSLIIGYTTEGCLIGLTVEGPYEGVWVWDHCSQLSHPVGYRENAYKVADTFTEFAMLYIDPDTEGLVE